MDKSIHNKVSGRDNNCITDLVCNIQDRLILNTFDTYYDFETKSRVILGSTQTDISMHHSTRSDFPLARLGSSGLDCAQEARWFVA